MLWKTLRPGPQQAAPLRTVATQISAQRSSQALPQET
jgi:hypothetical protein